MREYPDPRAASAQLPNRPFCRGSRDPCGTVGGWKSQDMLENAEHIVNGLAANILSSFGNMDFYARISTRMG